MVEIAEAYVVIYEEIPGGLEYEREGYTLEELGGTIPNVGDIIVYPGVLQGADRAKAESHTVREVVRRYFKPQTSDKYGARIILVVQSRPGNDDEIEVLYR